MSLLSRQLDLLQGQLPQTQVSSTRNASFLFPRSEQVPSASLRIMALKSLESLSRLNPDVQQYASLFSESSLDMDRGLLSDKENKAIHKNINSFCMILSPNFLLRPAQICLEYLVRIYNVHLYDVDSLLKCIIPFHGTLPFVSIVKLVHLTPHSTFSWLKQIQDARQVVQRSFLVGVCTRDFAFLEWIGDAAYEYAENSIPHRLMFSFFSALYLDYIQGRKLSEVHVKRILQVVMRGITNPNVFSHDYHRACLMLLVRVLSLMDIKSNPLVVILRDVLNSCIESNRWNDAILFCVYLFQSQSDVLSTLPLDLFNLFFPSASSRIDATPVLEKIRLLSSSYSVEHFTCALAATQLNICIQHLQSADIDSHGVETLPDAIEAQLNRFKELLHQLPQLDSFVSGCIPVLYKHAAQYGAVAKHLTSIVPVLDARYPGALDKAMKALSSEAHKDSFYQVFLDLSSQTKAAMERNTQVQISSDMLNANQDVRLKALDEMEKGLKDSSTTSSTTYKEFASKLVLENLNALDLNVLERILSIEGLLKLVDVEILIPRLIIVCAQVIGQYEESEFAPVLKRAFNLVFTETSSSDPNLMSAVLPFLFSLLHPSVTNVHKQLYDMMKKFHHPLMKNLSKPMHDSTSRAYRDAIMTTICANIQKSHSLYSMMVEVSQQSLNVSLVVLSIMVHCAKTSSNSENTLTYLSDAVSLTFDICKNSTEFKRNTIAIPHLSPVPEGTNEFDISFENYASITVAQTLAVLNREYTNGIPLKKLLKVFAMTDGASPLSVLVEQLTTLCLAGDVFESINQIQQLLELLGEGALMYLMTVANIQKNEDACLRALRVVSIIIRSENDKLCFQSLLPPLIALMGASTSSKAVRASCLEIVGLISAHKLNYNPQTIPLLKKAALNQLVEVLQKNSQLIQRREVSSVVQGYPNPLALATFFANYMRSVNNYEIHFNLISQLTKLEMSRNISSILIENVLVPLLNRLEKEDVHSVACYKCLELLIQYLVSTHIEKKDVNSREMEIFLRLLSMRSTPKFTRARFETAKVLPQFYSPSYIFGQALVDTDYDELFTSMSSEHKLQFSLELCDILSKEEKGGPLVSTYLQIAQFIPFNVETVLALFKKPNKQDFYRHVLELLSLSSVKPHPKLISKIFDLMRDYKTIRRGVSSNLSQEDDEMSDSDDDSSSESSSDSDSDSDSSSSDDDDSLMEEKEQSNKKTLSIEDSTFFVTCFTVLHSMISRVAVAFEKDTHSMLLDQCAESFDLEQTMKILSRSDHPQLFNSAMLCIDAMAAIFPSRMLQYVAKVVEIIGQSLKDNNITAVEISEKFILRLMPHLTQNVDDVFPLLQMLVNSFLSVPEERRLKLYTDVLKNISREYIFSLIVLFLEKYIDDSLPLYKSFCYDLLSYFNIEKQCHCLEKMAHFISSILKEPSNCQSLRSSALFGVSLEQSERSIPSIASMVTELSSFFSSFVGANSFLRRMTESLDSIDQEDVREEYNTVLQQYLFNIGALSVASMTDARNLQFERKKSSQKELLAFRADHLYTSSFESFKLIQQIMDASTNAKMYARLLNVNGKLYSQLFGQSADSSDDEQSSMRKYRIQAKAVDLFNALLADLSFENSDFLLTNSEKYAAVLSSMQKYILSQPQDNVPERNLQLCLISIDQLARRFAHLHPDQFAQVTPIVVEILNKTDNLFLQASCSLALTSICCTPFKKQEEASEEDAIAPSSELKSIHQQIPLIFESITEKMNASLNSAEISNDKTRILYCNGMMSSLRHLMRYCGKYSVPYISGIIDILLNISMSVLSDKVQALVHDTIQNIANNLSVRVLLRPLFAALSTAQRIGTQSTLTLFNILNTVFATLDTEAALQISDKTIKFFVQALDTRHKLANSPSAVNIDNIDQVEEAIIDSFRSFILKLNEEKFKPILVDLQKWANSGVEVDMLRLRSFYAVILMLNTTLKKLFVPFWTVIMDQALSHLRSTVVEASKSRGKRKRDESQRNPQDLHSVTISIVDSIAELCRNDNSNYLSGDDDLVQQLYHTLVDHFLNIACGSLEDYSERMEHVSSALVAVAKIAPQKQWNGIQQSIAKQASAIIDMDLTPTQKTLILSRSVRALRRIYEETPNFITQLADILPLVSELLEENDAAVQEEIGRFIQFLQKESGEDIREYLSRA